MSKKIKSVKVNALLSEMKIGSKARTVSDMVGNRTNSFSSSTFSVPKGSKIEVAVVNKNSIGCHMLELEYEDALVTYNDHMSWHVCFPKDSVVRTNNENLFDNEYTGE